MATFGSGVNILSSNVIHVTVSGTNSYFVPSNRFVVISGVHYAGYGKAEIWLSGVLTVATPGVTCGPGTELRVSGSGNGGDLASIIFAIFTNA